MSEDSPVKGSSNSSDLDISGQVTGTVQANNIETSKDTPLLNQIRAHRKIREDIIAGRNNAANPLAPSNFQVVNTDAKPLDEHDSAIIDVASKILQQQGRNERALQETKKFLSEGNAILTEKDGKPDWNKIIDGLEPAPEKGGHQK